MRLVSLFACTWTEMVIVSQHLSPFWLEGLSEHCECALGSASPSSYGAHVGTSTDPTLRSHDGSGTR